MIWSRCRLAKQATTLPGQRRWLTAPTLLLFSLLAACGADDPADASWNTQEQINQQTNQDQDNSGEHLEELNQGEELLPPADPERVAVTIETVLHSPNPMRAGDTLNVECRFLDQAGEVIDYGDRPPGQRVLQNPNDAFIRQGAHTVAAKATRAFVTCQSPQLGLTDPNPVEILIEPGPVHTVNTTLDDYQIQAGTSTYATCEAFDAFGNPIDDATFTILPDQTGPGIIIDNTTKKISLTTAGLYTFTCHVDGTTERFGQSLEVIPSLPAELIVALIPAQTTYGIGQVITLVALVQDQFGNDIPNAQINFQATPAGENFGQGRFRFFEDGIYTLSAHVTSPTLDDRVLYKEVDVVVHGSGPAILCDSPLDNSMVNHSPGSNLTIGGTAQHALGVDQVLVNGNPATLDQNGRFSATIQPRYGMNFVDIVARDTHGEESTRTCTFLVSNNWASTTNFIDDAITLRLSQDAIDDGTYDGNIQSLNDLLIRVLNSSGLRQMLLENIQASQPYQESVLHCSADIYVESITFPGAAHITSLTLTGGGLKMQAEFDKIDIKLDIPTSGILCPNFTPTLHLSSLSLGLTSDISLANNLPSFSLRQIDYVTSGTITLSGASGFSSALYSALSSLMQGTFRGIVENTFRDAIANNFNDLFDNLMSSLDVESLATTIEVPRLDSDNTINLDFGFRFSYANATSQRLLLGLAPRLRYSGLAAVPLESKGVPHPSGAIRYTGGSGSADVGVHISLLNQALHSLWRAGLLRANIASTLFGDDVPDGTSVRLDAQLPPMVALDGIDNSATVMLGGLRFSIQYPGLFDEPVNLTLGATATTSINLSGDELSFDDIILDEFHLSPDEISLNEESRDILEDFLRDLLQTVVDQSLNAALPALPIPSFTITPTMAGYGLPLNRELGVVNPEMNSTTRHITLRGQFGLR